MTNQLNGSIAPMAPTADSLIYAVVEPHNEAAKILMSNAVGYLDERQDSKHLGNLFIRNEAPPTPQSIGIETTHDKSDSVQSIQEPVRLTARMALRFGTPFNQKADWSFGAGMAGIRSSDQPVDFLLTIPRDQRVNGTGVKAFSIELNTATGPLVLRAGDSTMFYNVNGEDKRLERDKARVLFQRKNVFRLENGLEYALHYVIPEDKHMHNRLARARDDLLRRRGKLRSPLSYLWSWPPKLSNSIVGIQGHFEYLLIDTPLPSGADAVFPAVDLKTRDPIYLKRRWISDPAGEQHSVIREIEFGKEAKKSWTAVQYPYSHWCTHRYQQWGIWYPCAKKPEDVWISFAQYDSTFEHHDWNTVSISNRISLFHWALAGIHELHANGIMHRALVGNNILIPDCGKPRSCISNLSKAIRANRSNDTHIGPKYTLAPEVFSQHKDIYCEKGYDDKIDIWALAYSFTRTLGYRPQEVDFNCPTSFTVYGHLRRVLVKTARQEKQLTHLCELLEQMLCWRPQDRPSAAEALQYHGFTEPLERS